MKFPKELTTVTPLSKGLALSMFVFIPFVTFIVGINIGEGIIMNQLNMNEPSIKVLPQRLPSITTTHSLSEAPSFTWQEYKPNGTALNYLNTKYQLSFEYLAGFNVLENKVPSADNEYYKNRLFDILVLSDSDKNCLYGADNPCKLTDQPLGIVEISGYDVTMNTDLKKWVMDRYPQEPVKTVSTMKLGNGIAIHDKGIGDGSYYMYFYNSTKHLVIEFYSRKSNFAQTPAGATVVNSFEMR